MVLAVWALAAVVLAAWLGTRREAGRASGVVPPNHALEPLTPWRVAGRVLGVGLLVLAVVAGRLGNERELSNIAPALVVGVAWPALVAGSLLLGRVWAALDPWDGLARVLRAPDGDPERRDVWPAALVALAWVWYLAVPSGALAPRTVGLAVALYSLVTLAGCLVAGRVAWLARAELFGLLSGWLALLRGGRLRAWVPPAGTEVVLGALAGGLLFGELRRGSVWGPVAIHPRADVWNALGVVAAAALVAGAAFAVERGAARRGLAGIVPAALVPLAGGVALAASLARDRALVAAQVVLVRASDPLGRGWDLFGTADWPVWPSPLGHTGRDLLQYLVLLAGGAAAAWVASRRARRLVGSVLLLVGALSGVAVLVLLSG